MPDKRSCITDRPIADSGADYLDNRRYAQGLINFIRKADTPITIGIQGGWGSGKTSLINIIQKETETPRDTEEGGVVCVVVNAWEHSLLKTGGGKGEIVISLLSGLIMEINDAIKGLKGSGVDEDVITQALNEKTGLLKALSLCKNVGMAVGLTAVKMVAQTQGIPLTSVGAGQQQAAVEAAPSLLGQGTVFADYGLRGFKSPAATIIAGVVGLALVAFILWLLFAPKRRKAPGDDPGPSA